jgi:hypothetical protein
VVQAAHACRLVLMLCDRVGCDALWLFALVPPLQRSARSKFSVLAPCLCPCSLTTVSPLSEILPTLRSIKSTARMIDTRLLCATNNPNEVASPAFGTF